jgi:hypothetical protein
MEITKHKPVRGSAFHFQTKLGVKGFEFGAILKVVLSSVIIFFFFFFLFNVSVCKNGRITF